jgi:hypothetical protein
MAMQFKTVTQMTQMTQSMTAGMHGHAGASMRRARPGTMAASMRRYGHQQITTIPEGGWVGPTAKGQQKRTDREQFFLATKFFFL